MRVKNQKIVNNAILNDFIYTVLYNASYEQKRGLEQKFLKAANNEASAKKFATKSTKEEKERILSHFGLSYFYVICKNGIGYKQLKGLLQKFEKGKTIAAMHELAELELFVTGDKDFLRLLTFMSQSIHHPSYFMNLEFLRQGYHIKKWSKRNLNREDLESREINETSTVLAKIFLRVSATMDNRKSVLGMTRTEMEILLYLWQFYNTMVSQETLYDYFIGYKTKYDITTSLRKLLENLLIEKQGVVKKKGYVISNFGIQQVKKFFDQIVQP